MAGGHQRVWSDKPASANPHRVISRLDQQRGMDPPRIDRGIRNLDAIIRTMHGLCGWRWWPKRGFTDVPQLSTLRGSPKFRCRCLGSLITSYSLLAVVF